MERSQLNPVQRICDACVEPVPFFDAVGPLGMSAMAIKHAQLLYFTTGNDLHRLDLATGELTVESIPGLVDVHEINLIGDSLWIANTGADEALEFDTNSGKVASRLKLEVFRSIMPETTDQGAHRRLDRFHCNQIFQGLDGHRYALVHHVTGFQFMHKIAERLIKSHGHGGVINLDQGNSIPLGLKAPHSVRIVGDRYFVCDSGAACIRIYDSNWRQTGCFDTRGFGRGAAYSVSRNLYYVGISATRARYLGVHRGPDRCLVQAFDADKLELRAETALPNAEQISNLYIFPRSLTLENLPPYEMPRIASA